VLLPDVQNITFRFSQSSGFRVKFRALGVGWCSFLGIEALEMEGVRDRTYVDF